MCCRNRLLSVFLMAVLLLGIAQPAMAQDTAAEAPAGHGIRFDAPPYAIDGPYGVGVRYFAIPAENEKDRDLTVSVWYPAQTTEAASNEMVYDPQFPTGEFPPYSVLGHAQLDAAPDVSGGPYPLVVYSHAHWSMGQEVPYLTEHLASRGFVVISDDHEDNWSTAFGPLAYEAMIRRPQEVTRLIDFAEGLSASDGKLAGMIATDRVGVSGWSMGGATSYAAAGAQMDLDTLHMWCAENPAGAELNTWACVDMLDHEAEMATFAGLDGAPAGLWPSQGDPRVAAIAPLAGPTLPFGSTGMAAIKIPVLLMIGSGETAEDPSFDMGAPYESVTSARKAKVVFDYASHLLFNSSCEANQDIAAIGFPMFCSDPVWDMDRAHDLINHFTTAFFEAELKGDADAASALAEENVAFPAVEFQSAGYSSDASGTALDEATVAKIEGIIEKAMTDYPAPGFEMCVVKDGDVVYSKGFGLADVAENRPATPQTLQLQASISKSLTAAAIMHLAEQGLINLDAPVTDYLPTFTMADDRYHAITVRMLLSHRSGLPDKPLVWSEPLDPAMNPLEQAARSLSETELLFAPDEEWSYSDYGYLVLGATIAAITGQPYESYMAEQWLAPLEMTRSTFVTEETDPSTRMTGYVSDESGKPTPTDIGCDARDASACNLWSNCEDMAKYAQFMMKHGEVGGTALLQPKSIEAMWTPISETPWAEMNGPWYGPPLQNYGLGWVLGEAAGHRLVGHPGGLDGYNSQILLAPDDGLAVLTMDNWLDLAAVPAFPASFAATDIMYALLGIEAEMSGAAPAAQETMADTSTPEVFVQGSLLPGLSDIAVGADGSIYGAAELTNAIRIVDPDSGALVDQIPVGDDTAEALTIGPDGSVYWSSFYSLNVCRLSPAGEKSCQAMPTDVWGLAFSPDGRLFVATEAHVATLYELDPLLIEEPRLVKEMGTLISHFAFGPDGMLYAPLMSDGTIVRVDVDAEPVTAETVAEGLIMPWGVAFDSTGQLYAATSLDAEHNALLRIDAETGASEQLGLLPAGYHVLAIGEDDRIFLGHYDEGALYEYLLTGEMRAVTTPGMIGPGGLAVLKRADGGESLFVAGWKTLHEFDTASGEPRNAWRSGWFPGMISPPRAAAADGANLLVSGWEDQWGGNLVQVWDPIAGASIAAMDTFVRPANVIRFQGDLVVIEMVPDAAWRIQRTDGDDVTSLHTLGGDMLQQPLGLAASDDALWVADYATGNVYQLVADGAELTEPVLVASGLDRPEGMALGADGRLLVAETGTGRLLAIDPATGEIAVVTEGLGFMRENPPSIGPVQLAPFRVFSGVALDKAGNIYVAADDANVIYRIPAAVGAAQAGALDEGTAAKIDSIVETVMFSSSMPGAAVGIVKDGELVYAKGFGVTELGGDQPVTPDSVFAMASVAKTVTGMAIMQLVEEGKIDLDAPVTDYIPYFTMADDRYKEITIRQLLSHTSGMGDYGDFLTQISSQDKRTDDAALDDYVRSFSDGSLLFAPGEGWYYSGAGFDTLGDVVAKVSGQSFEAYVQEHILAPLSMKDSTFLLDDIDPAALVAPHTWDEDGNVIQQDFFPYVRMHAPESGLLSTVRDMARFAIANMNHGELNGQRVLASDAYDEMWAPQAASTWVDMFGPQVTNYGLGWWVGEFQGQPIIGNYGAFAGFQTHLGIFPAQDFAVVAMVNAYNGENGVFGAYEIGNEVAALLLEAEY